MPEMSDHSRCHRTSVGRHFQFVFHKPNGDKISTGMYDTRIHDRTAVSWLWNIVRDEIDHPIDYVHLVIGGKNIVLLSVSLSKMGPSCKTCVWSWYRVSCWELTLICPSL